MRKKNKIKESADKNSTPNIIRIILFFVIIASVIAVLFNTYVLIFNTSILSEEISLAKNHFLSLKNYILLETLMFLIIIFAAILTLYLKKIAFSVIVITLSLLLIMNYVYFEKIDWINFSITIIFLLVLVINWKKIK